MSISNIAEGIGSQAAFKIDASTSLSMTFKRWVKCYIVTSFFYARSLCHYHCHKHVHPVSHNTGDKTTYRMRQDIF